MKPLGTSEHLLILSTLHDGIAGHCNCDRWHRDGDTRAEVRAAHREHVETVVAEREAEWEAEPNGITFWREPDSTAQYKSLDK